MSATHAAWGAGVAVLLAAAWLRGAEYDEQYTLFLTAGVARPAWPATPFPAALVQAAQIGHAGFSQIMTDLRQTDVHPPIYFWIVSLWRTVFGPTLFAARLLSVAFGAMSLVLVGRIARQIGASPAVAVLTTALCYGFAYTNVVTRGFAPAETALLAGMLFLQGQEPNRAGLAFGIAAACNYLSIFPAIAASLVTRSWRAIPAAIPFLLLDAWCFTAQHGSRAGQFPPFHLFPVLLRLARYQVAAIFGALPVYWPTGPAHWVASGAVVAASVAVFAGIIRHWRTRRVLAAAAIAPAIGLLILGILFDNAPIEFRYLSFGLPFLALLAAEAGPAAAAVCLIQAAGIAGLLLAPQTMQPARAAARFAAPYAGHALALLPAGNDGVGIVGAFGIEAPPDLMLSLVRPNQPVVIPDETTQVVLILTAQDAASRSVIPKMQAAVVGWHLTATSPNAAIYRRDAKSAEKNRP